MLSLGTLWEMRDSRGSGTGNKDGKQTLLPSWCEREGGMIACCLEENKVPETEVVFLRKDQAERGAEA